MLKPILYLFPMVLLIVGCQTTPPDTPKPEKTSVSSDIKAEKQPDPNQTEEVVSELTYSEDWTFEWTLSQALRNNDTEVTLLTPEGVSLNEIPEPLDKWLSRIKENGGTVKAKAIPVEGEMKTRSLIGALLDVVLYLIGIAKEEATYSAADDYNALLNYDSETGAVTSIQFLRK